MKRIFHRRSIARTGQRPCGKWHKHGFTLIELLLVIAIISVLAAMLLPALAKARAAAYKTSCMNKQKNIYMAQQFYADDHNDILSVHSYDPDEGYYGYNSALIMLGYAGTLENIRKGTESLFYCPTKIMLGNRWSYGYREGDYGVNIKMKYTMNGAWSNPVYPYFRRRYAFRPTKLFLTGDANSSAPGNGKKIDGYNAELRHDGRAIFSFHDGHVAARSREKCFQVFTGWGKLPFYNAK